LHGSDSVSDFVKICGLVIPLMEVPNVMEEEFNRSISDEDGEKMALVQDAIDHIQKAVGH
jgi:hypothetical protein